MVQSFIVKVDDLGGSVVPNPGNPAAENSMIQLVKFLGRAAEAAGRAVACKRPVLKLTWERGEVHVTPLEGGGYLGFILLDQRAPRQTIHASAHAGASVTA